MPKPSPIPSPIPSSADECVCRYKSEIETVRRWTRIGAVVFATFLAGIGGLSVYSCDASQRAGALSAEIRHLATEQGEHRQQIEALRASDRELERSGLETQQQILITLGELRAMVGAMSSRLERVEDAQAARPRGRR